MCDFHVSENFNRINFLANPIKYIEWLLQYFAQLDLLTLLIPTEFPCITLNTRHIVYLHI